MILAAVLALFAAQDSSPSWPHWLGPHRDGISRETEWSAEGRSEDLWRAEVGLGYSSVSIAGGRLLTLGHDEEAELDSLYCLDAETGKDIWEDAIQRSKDKYYASPILAGDLLYCIREDGMVASVKVSDSGMEVLSENLMGERIAAAPVPVNNKLLIRGETHLFCIGSK